MDYLRTGTYRAQKISEVRSLQDVPTRTLEIEKLTTKLSRRTWHGKESCVPRFRPLPYHEEQTTEARPSSEQVQNAYFYPECFEHFHYIRELLQDCRSRVNNVRKISDPETTFDNEVMIKINYIGGLNDNVPIQKAIQKGKGEVSLNKKTWEASPLLCFQNDLSFTEALRLLKANTACHKILVKSGDVGEDACTADETIVIVDQDHVREVITSCLEEPLRQLLEKWLKEINATDTSKETVWVIVELESIRKQMSLKESKATTSSPTFGCANIVPPDVKDYLLGRDDVSAFGTWLNSQFKVFMKNGADAKRLQKELTEINKGFFEKFKLEIETRTFFEQRSMRQGGQILPNPPNPDGQYTAGTLGGFVTKTEEPNRKFALTCNHIFPMTGLPAYADSSQQFEMIGKCVFTTRENHCDFAAIEIDESISNKCNVAFRREDKKETNAHVYEDCINNLALLHKIGAESDVTTGIILSDEFYVNHLTDDDNKDFLFLVRGLNGLFSKNGDSGSLVFSRPREVIQNYVYVVGMVYAFDVTVYEKEESTKQEAIQRQPRDGSVENDSDTSSSSHKEKEMPTTDVSINPEHVSICYRIRPALNLFQENQGYLVKFKDDIPSSSSSIF